MITVERLEEIKKLIENSTGGQWYRDHENLIRDKEKNKRIANVWQSLNGNNDSKFIAASKSIIYELLNEIKTKNKIILNYEKTLEFYAKKEHYESHFFNIHVSDISEDGGESARFTLNDANNINKEK